MGDIYRSSMGYDLNVTMLDPSPSSMSLFVLPYTKRFCAVGCNIRDRPSLL